MMLRFALLFALCLGVSGTTCGILKEFYKESNCCGNPARTLTGALNCGSEVTLAMVTAAQAAWGAGIVSISSSYTDGGDYEAVARDHINNLYGYAEGTVLFKPTLAADEQFRGTFDGALSYFVAKNDQAPNTVISEDSGFAIKGWTAVRFENTEVILSGNTATAMGNYFFTNSNGVSKVEYTFGYFLDAAGNLRINVHHSALPYQPSVTLAMVTAAQDAWGAGIVSISTSYTDGGDYEAVARDHITNLYGYFQGEVLFKPTLAADEQFRGTYNSALSYFVAKNDRAPDTVISEDSGFAIKGWTAVRFENTEVILSGSTAAAMGNYFFTNSDGNETKVEYTFGYFLDAAGDLRINVHHSALPYPPQVTLAMVTAAQDAWGDGIVNIATSYADGGDYEAVARDHIMNLYGYAQGTVLFKPTLAADEQFRGTFDGALSYFVAMNSQAPSTVISEDSGFAIKPWSAVRFENEGVILYQSTATAMGNYFFTNSTSGIETKVEYSFGYFLDSNSSLRINLHKSALPYDPSR